MNTVLQTIERRYSCRSYTNQPVSREQLDACALAGVQAPSSRGHAPWRIVVVTDPDLIQDLSDSALRLLVRREPAAAARFETLGVNLFYDAPAVMVIAARHTWDYTSEDIDVGLAAQNITLAATSLGLGSLILGFITQAFRDIASDDPARLYARLDLPREFEVRVAVAIGHPDRDRVPHTPDLSVVTYI